MNAKLVAISIWAVAMSSSSWAQSPQVPFDPADPQFQAPKAAKQSQPKGKAAPAKEAKAAAPADKKPAEAGAADGSSQLRSRVDQIEEQIVDIQVTMGTLESLARGAGSGSSSAASSRPAGGGGGYDAGRVESLETQIRALTAQVEQLTQQIRSLEGRGTTSGSLSPSSGSGFPSRSAAAPATPGGFGDVTVRQGEDEIGSLIEGQGAPGGAPRASGPGRTGAATPPQGGMVAPISADPGAANTTPKQAYEAAYTMFVQQDFAGAEAGFDEFLKRYPNDQLAGNAQYWLGETFFFRGQFKQAAAAYLKGFQNYSKSVKAPDSLLKLGMSLERLGQKEAACSTYGELSTRFPNAAAYVKSRVQTERTRLACT